MTSKTQTKLNQTLTYERLLNAIEMRLKIKETNTKET